MKILQIHNKYQLSGGEDVVVENEKRLLEGKGNKVLQYIKTNTEINNYSIFRKISLLNRSIWSKESYNEIVHILKREKPDICHVHNYMPLISPAVFYACKENDIPVVQTLHNYRMICANAYLFRNGNICEECLQSSLVKSIKYNCYRNSRIQTIAVARMIEHHKSKGTFKNVVDGYIYLSNFAKEKFIEGGLPENKLYFKPNFIYEDPGYSETDEGYLFFAGRLDEQKGIHLLIEAANKLPKIQFKIAGEGLLKEKVIAEPNMEYVGHLSNEDMIKYMRNCISLIFPSILYETFGLSIIEAYACGKAVIASNHGSMAELVKDRNTGLLVSVGNTNDLVDKINWAFQNKKEMKQMGLNARTEYEMKYIANRNYELLYSIYEKVVSNY